MVTYWNFPGRFKNEIKKRSDFRKISSTYQHFSDIQVVKGFKIDKRTFGLEYCKNEFEIELCTIDEHVIAKTYKLIKI